MYLITNGKEFVTFKPRCSKIEFTDSKKDAHRFLFVNGNNIANNQLAGKGFICVSEQMVSGIVDLGQKLDIDNILVEMESLINPIREYQLLLNSRLCFMEKKKLDIEHEIELSNSNASQGYKLYKKLQDCLFQRRKIKDDLQKISYIYEMGINGISTGNTRKSFEGLENRKYAPRVS